MDTGTIQVMSADFEQYVHEVEGVEFWYARALQKVLGYTKW